MMLLTSLTLNKGLYSEDLQEGIDPKSLGSDEYVIDEILATIYHPQKEEVISRSDLRPGLDGIQRELDDIIFEKLILIDAQRLHIDEMSDEEVNRLLVSIQESNKLTRDQIVEAFKQSGFTEEEGRNELKKGEIVRRMMQYRIKDKMIVDKEDIESYYNEHPESTPGSLTISQTIINFTTEEKKDSNLKAKKLKSINSAIESKDILNILDWDTPFEIQEEELPEDKVYLKDLAAGSVVKIKETDDSITLLHVVAKKPSGNVPLEEREQAISELLREQRYKNAYKEYKQSLLDSVFIKYHKENKK